MHKLDTPTSDEDVRYITMPSLRDIVSPFKNDKIKVRDGNGADEESWAISHFIVHLTHGNPTVYEVIKSPLYDTRYVYSDTIRSLMPLAFDGIKILKAHIGYAESQLSRYFREADGDFLKVFGKHCFSDPHISDIREENQIRRLPKATVAAYRVLSQARQLLETGDFHPVISDYSQELHDKLMGIKTMDDSLITWSFVKEHIEGIELEIKKLHAFFDSLPEDIKNKKPDLDAIENVLYGIYKI